MYDPDKLKLFFINQIELLIVKTYDLWLHLFQLEVRNICLIKWKFEAVFLVFPPLIELESISAFNGTKYNNNFELKK